MLTTDWLKATVTVTKGYLFELYDEIDSLKARLHKHEGGFPNVSQGGEHERQTQSRRGDSNSRPHHYE